MSLLFARVRATFNLRLFSNSDTGDVLIFLLMLLFILTLMLLFILTLMLLFISLLFILLLLFISLLLLDCASTNNIITSLSIPCDLSIVKAAGILLLYVLYSDYDYSLTFLTLLANI